MVEETSKQALKELGKKRISERQLEVYKALKELCKVFGDATDQEIRVKLGKADPNYVRPRRYELVNSKHLKVVGFNQKRICRITGKVALAWKSLNSVRGIHIQ